MVIVRHTSTSLRCTFWGKSARKRQGVYCSIIANRWRNNELSNCRQFKLTQAENNPALGFPVET
jgi:hypothetical protein